MSSTVEPVAHYSLIELFIAGCAHALGPTARDAFIHVNAPVLRSVLATLTPRRKARQFVLQFGTITDIPQALDLAYESGIIRWIGSERQSFVVTMLEFRIRNLRDDPRFQGALLVARTYLSSISLEPHDHQPVQSV
jgi:hypothetical protein